jgi:CTP:molybdopterin cytidylyltransferase MocA
MKDIPRYCGVILAAGASTRMGRNKALLAWPPANIHGSTFLSSAISALKLVAELVVVVAGRNRAELEPIATGWAAHVAVNPEPERGHFSSLQVGLRELVTLGCDTAIITPVDRPPLGERHLESLRRAYEQSSDVVWAMIPTHNGENGHPLIAGPRLIDELLRAPVESNAHEVMTAHAGHLSYLELSDPTVTLNVNTPDEYQQAATLLKGK